MAYPDTYTHGYEPEPEDVRVDVADLAEQMIADFNREMFPEPDAP